MILGRLPFREVVFCDFEFRHAQDEHLPVSDGEKPFAVCMVAREMVSGRLIKLWRDQFGPEPPFATGEDVLFVAFVAQAELGCFLELGWPLPSRILDLSAEFRVASNGLPLAAGKGLLGALSWYCIPGITKEEKKSNRDLVLRGGPWTDTERREILDYCQSDVDVLPPLLTAMLPGIMISREGLAQALLRGRYTAAVAHMERNGIPIDVHTLTAIQAGWDDIKMQLIAEVDAQYGVYDDGHFRDGFFAKYLLDQEIPWPRTDTGLLKTDEDTFKDMSKVYPQLAPLRELRHALGQLRLKDLVVGADGRNRASLWPFTARTGRNAPSSTGYVFGPSVWLRSLVKPQPGMAIAYIDWSAQEIAIAAALSGDPFLIDSIASGDPYIHFAVQAGLVPADATKATHPQEREICKQTLLGTQYGMGARSLAFRIGRSRLEAEAMLGMLARTYPVFSAWRESTVDDAFLRNYITTRYGWRLHVTGATKPTALKNYPMQAHGAHMLQIACCLATERGVRVIAPVHDAVMVEAPLDSINDTISVTQGAMAEAAAAVIGSEVWIDTDTNLVTYPNRYRDPRGQVMWDRVNSLLKRPGEAAQPSELSGLSI
jgi:DNA polymerase-1